MTSASPTRGASHRRYRLDTLAAMVLAASISTAANADVAKQKGDDHPAMAPSVTAAELAKGLKDPVNSKVMGAWNAPADTAGLSGTVNVLIAPNGHVFARQVSSSSGLEVFDDAMLDAVERAGPFALPATKQKDQKSGFQSFHLTFHGHE